MSVRINLGKWGSVFVVPSCVVDEHLKIAGHNQLKVLLFLLKNSEKSYTYKEIGEALSMHEADVKDSVDFWIEREVIAKLDGVLVPEKANELETEKTVERQKAPEKKSTVTRPIKPDIITAAQIINADEKLQGLLSEVEAILSKPLSSGGTSVIVMLYDTCGLPAEVIVMLVNYCVSLGKTDMRTIERIGVKWADDGINTIESADNRIAESKRSNENWNRVKYVFGLRNAGSPTSKQLEFADKWVGQWHFSDEMLRVAYELNVDSTGKMSLPYIDKILKRWYDAGIFNVDDIEKADKTPAKKPSKKSSYNLDELMKIQ
ncbi:MAG: DnaD domain protein [Ruminococcus sp.]|nr:DnaD domain protein [Ruminococcus sp.]